MSDMVSVPAEKIAALREAARTKIFGDGPNANALYKAARAVVDAVETEAAPDELTALRDERDFWKDNDNKRSAKVRKMRAERDALRESIRALADETGSAFPYVQVRDLRALLGDA